VPKAYLNVQKDCLKMKIALAAVAALFLTSFAAQAAAPNMLGTWVTDDDFVNTGSNPAVPGWPASRGPKAVVTPKPSVVFTDQNDRQVSGYIVSPNGRVPFHAILKHSGTGLVGRNVNGLLTADINGDQMEWCFAGTAPKVDVVACNMMHRQGTK
jgi:hypothetical protein